MMHTDKMNKKEFIGFKCEEYMSTALEKAQIHYTDELGMSKLIGKSELIRMHLLGKIDLSPFIEKEQAKSKLPVYGN